jgi:hypothetical protein
MALIPRTSALALLLMLMGCDDSDRSPPPEPDIDEDTDVDTEDTGPEDECELLVWYRDADKDGFGTDTDTVEDCEQPTGYVDNSDDCNDDRADINPDAEEVCDDSAVDEDCDGDVNGQDDDVAGMTTWYLDADDDGFGDPDSPFVSCNQPSGYVTNSKDDNDGIPYGTELDCGACTMLVVPSGEAGPGEYDTIQDAIDDASVGEVICASAGQWRETIDFSGKDIALCGSEGAEETVIDGDGRGPVVRFAGGESNYALLQGFTITGGDHHEGAGVYINNSEPTLEDLIITQNTCGSGLSGDECHGVGLFIRQSSTTMARIEVSENIAYHEGWYGYQQSRGGGIYIASSTLDISGLKVLKNIVKPHANQSNIDGVVVYGGGLYSENSTVNITDVMFVGNAVTGTMDWFEETVILGSALYAESGSGLTMERVLIADNVLDSMSSYPNRGTVYVLNTSFTMTNGAIINNEATSSSPIGVIAYMSGVTSTISNVVMAGNQNIKEYDSDKGVGGIYFTSTTMTLRSSTFSDNYATGSALYQSGGSLTCTQNNFYGDSLFSGLSTPVGSQGNISVDPDFIDASGAAGLDWDLHLSTSSELIDAGSPSDTDPDGSSADIGAFGGQGGGDWDLDWDGSPSWWQPGEYDSSYTKDNLDCDDLDSSVNATDGCP